MENGKEIVFIFNYIKSTTIMNCITQHKSKSPQVLVEQHQ